MILEYRPGTDTLFIGLAARATLQSEEVSPGVVLDLDEQGRATGIEIEAASQFVVLSVLEVRTFQLASLDVTREGMEQV